MRITKKYIDAVFIILALVGILTGIGILTFGYYDFIKTVKDSRVVRPSSLSKEVLFIGSYSESYPYTREQMRGFNRVFGRYGIPYDSAFMDTKVYNTEENVGNFYKTIKYKMSVHEPYKAIIVGDDPALDFVMKHYDELFSGVPIVFLGANDERLAEEAALKPMVTGSTEHIAFDSIFANIERLFPNVKNIAVIYDDSNQTTVGCRDQFFRFIKGRNLVCIEIHTRLMCQTDIIEKIRGLSDDTVIFNVGMYNDFDGHKYSITESADIMTSNSSVPCFTMVYETIGRGILGATIFDISAAAEYTAQTVVDILGGADVSKIPLRTDIGSDLIFDWNVMKRFGLDVDELSSDASVINVPKGYIAEYSFIFYPTVLVVTSLMVLLMILFVYTMHIRKIREKLESQVSHNMLTKLPSRSMALSRIEALMEQGTEFSVVMLDIEEFRVVNDYYSQEFGDRMLVEMAERLRSLSSSWKFEAFSFAGDEFTLVHTSGHIQEDGFEIGALRDALSVPFCADENPIFVKTAIGIINSDIVHPAAEDYLINAEIAMYEAKKIGSNKNALFTLEMRKAIEKRHNIVRDVEFACENDGFFVVFQPQVITKDDSVFGYEALTRLRLEDENGKIRIVPPVDFIPVAEKSGYIAKIGRIITEKTILAMVNWRNNGMKLRKVSINFSAAQIADSGYVSYLEELLRKHNIAPKLICIEITESLFLGNRKQATELFEQFKKLGVQLALDDFGTGYSSLSYLAYLPVDIVKIDKTMVDNYLSVPDKSVFVENIVNLVHSLNMKLIVEGIETKWQYDKIKMLGGDYIQGYFFSKPILPEEVETFKVNISNDS
nr:EAL domain-containing protein [Treponema sp.]